MDKFLKGENFWRLLVNFWTIFIWIFIVFNFIFDNRYEGFLGAISAIYSGVLSLYVGTKEFRRWHKFYDTRHPGEIFIIGWTILMIGLLLASLSLGDGYKVPGEVIANYIVVLSVFAITQESKKLYKKVCGK